MRNTIKININYNDDLKEYYYSVFTIIEKLPEITNYCERDEVVEIKKIEKDCEQCDPRASEFDCYKLKRIDYQNYNEDRKFYRKYFNENVDVSDYIYYQFVAVPKKDD